MEKNRWYKDRVFYQIWPRSFCDSNGDGIGDLQGVLSRLDYLKHLGVDGIWFSPLYASPNADMGYDISDYYSINPEYGTMEDFRAVLEGAHGRGMKVIMDLVVNHTSDEHPWFIASRDKNSPYRDYYFWREGKKRPNNWSSLFEGKAWEWDPVAQAWYLHIFAKKQPDLNMDNPKVREEVKNIMRFWLEMGVDGFREDVITFISKRPGLPNGLPIPAACGMEHYMDGPNVHRYLKEFREVLNEYDCFVVGEAPMMNEKNALRYIKEGPKQELDMMFHFEHMEADCLFTDVFQKPFDLRKLKKAFSKWQYALQGKGWNALYLENHDHPRIISRYGSEKYRVVSGKMLANCYMLQQGTPFIYQGQEIGMLNWYPMDPDMYEDVQTRWQYENVGTKQSAKKRLERLWHGSRDSARTPVQWDDSENAGFSTAKPWFYVNENYKTVDVEAQESDQNSVLNFYRKAIKLRRELSAVKDGNYTEYGKSSSKVYTYVREDEKQKILVVCSFSEKNVKFKAPMGFDTRTAELILTNYEANDGMALKPYETRVYLLNK